MQRSKAYRKVAELVDAAKVYSPLEATKLVKQTVTNDVGKAVADIKGGKINYRVDKQGNLHLVIGKASFSEQQLVENYAAALDEVLRAKPSAAKGKYLKKITFTTTMGPGIQVDTNKQRNLMEDASLPG